MKQLLTAMILILFSIPCGGQTLLLSEDFEGTNPPTGWTRTQNSPSAGWEFGSDLGSQYVSFPAHTTYAASNDDAHDDPSGTSNLADRDRLITPNLDLTPYASEGVVLEFDYVQPGTYGSIGSVEVSSDGGVTWTAVATMTSTSEWISESIDLSSYTFSSSLQIAFRHNDNGAWADGFAIDDVTVRSAVSLDVGVDEVTIGGYIPPGSNTITALITNHGSAMVTSVAAVYQVESGNPTPGTIGGLTLGLGQSVEVAHPIPFNFGSTGESDIEFTVTAVNGGADGNPANNTATSTVNVLSEVPTKRPVLEVHTGAWCQFCPDGTVRMEEVAASIPNSIVVTVHNSDSMVIPDGNTLASTYIGGYPSATIDRYKFSDQTEVEVNRGIWLSKTAERASHVVPVEASIPMVAYDPATRILEVEVRAEFFGSASGDLRFNCWIVEDTIVGSGYGYDQVNYYNTVPGHPYFGAGNPIVGFVHDRVVRAMFGGAWGTSGEIPGVVAAGEAYSTTYSEMVPNWADETKLRLVAVVSRYESDTTQRHILNAFEMPLTFPVFSDGFESSDTSAWSTSTP